MAVQIVAYELFKAKGNSEVKSSWDRPHASHSEIDAMYEHLDHVFGCNRFFLIQARQELHLRAFRECLLESNWMKPRCKYCEACLTHIERAIAVKGE